MSGTEINKLFCAAAVTLAISLGSQSAFALVCVEGSSPSCSVPGGDLGYGGSASETASSLPYYFGFEWTSSTGSVSITTTVGTEPLNGDLDLYDSSDDLITSSAFSTSGSNSIAEISATLTEGDSYILGVDVPASDPPVNIVFGPQTAVPEPGSLALLGAGLLGFAGIRFRRRNS